GDHELIWRLVFFAVAVPELGAGDKDFQNLPNIAIGLQKTRREPVDQRRRRLIGDKILRQLETDMAGPRRGGGPAVAPLRASSPSALPLAFNVWPRNTLGL